MSAFGKAMFAQLAQPDRRVTFRMSDGDGNAIDCPCHDFLKMRTEERDIIGLCLGGNLHPSVLDIGCGVGRHSSLVRSLSPGAAITVVETDRELRDYAVRVNPGAVGYEQLDDIPADARFDVVFLLGNGLGVFGTERTTREGIRRIHGILSERGCALIESGNPFPGDFHAARLQIKYGDLTDGPFTWGGATRGWLERELGEIGFDVTSFTRSSMGGPFFIIHATRSA